MKSLRRMGSAVAARAAARSSGDPLKKARSVRTEMAEAPPAVYARARAAGSRPTPMSPLEGEARLISAVDERLSFDLAVLLPLFMVLLAGQAEQP